MRKVYGTHEDWILTDSVVSISQEDQHVENSFPHGVRDLDGANCLLSPVG
jgi:hypothetical protein